MEGRGLSSFMAACTCEEHFVYMCPRHGSNGIVDHLRTKVHELQQHTARLENALEVLKNTRNTQPR